MQNIVNYWITFLHMPSEAVTFIFFEGAEKESKLRQNLSLFLSKSTP